MVRRSAYHRSNETTLLFITRSIAVSARFDVDKKEKEREREREREREKSFSLETAAVYDSWMYTYMMPVRLQFSSIRQMAEDKRIPHP